MRPGSRALGALVVFVAAGIVATTASPAFAYEWTRPLSQGDQGPDVRALQVRVAGWFEGAPDRRLYINGRFRPTTTEALRAFQAHYGLTPDGIAGEETFAALEALQGANGTTKHFRYSEFVQKRNSSCSARANAYAGTFGGGMVSPARTRRYVRRLMWRLEALRAKGGDNPVGINSGFRSVPYNTCIGGARASQHLYGTAADARQANVANRRQRNLAKRSAVSGIGCYSSMSHNHLDVRLENPDLSSSRFVWWPKRDKQGRDLDYAGKPCWGERNRTVAGIEPITTAAVLRAVRAALPGAGSLLPTAAEIEAFQSAGEPRHLHGAD